MEKPATLASAIEALEASESRCLSLEKDLQNAEALLNEASANSNALSEKQQLIAKLENALAEAQVSISDLTASLDEANQRASLSEIKLNEALAGAGVPPVSVSGTQANSPASKEELWDQFKALSVYDRPAFWAKHRSVLTS